MSDNKKKSDQPTEDELLQQKVDEMMDIRGGKSTTSASDKQASSKAPEIDIFKDTAAASKVAEVIPINNAGSSENLPKGAPPIADDGSVPEPSGAIVESDQPQETQVEPKPLETKEDSLPPIDDEVSDKAVDEIVASEADTVLEAEDAANHPMEPIIGGTPRWQLRLKRLFKSKLTWIVVGLLVLIFALPMTRYTILGLFWKQSVPITVLDSKTNTPVSNAAVQLDGVKTKTDNSGKAVAKVALGQQKLHITKQYYDSYDGTYFVGIRKGPAVKISLDANGRQVPVTVVNKISGEPLADAEIVVSGTSAKTDSKGLATIVLPTKKPTLEAIIKLKGYNDQKTNLQITSKKVTANTVSLTPAGHIYFLSNLDGNIDVVKSNLDGTGRKVVLAGTGKEDANNTVLLASRDWRYLVLKAKRDTTHPVLYLIDTSNDIVTAFDNSNATFNLIGWYDHEFLYDMVSNSVPQTQAGREQIKTYDAERGQLNQIDSNQAEGKAANYAYQSFYNFYIVDGALVYNTQWDGYDSGGIYNFGNKTASIRAVDPGGQNKKDYQTFPAASVAYIQAVLYEPQVIYYSVYNATNDKTTYYAYENQAITKPTGLTQSSFVKDYPTYLISPDDSHTFWTELRDGKNTLFIGDQNAGNKKQIASLSEYSPYGWFSDKYVLVSKKGSELYVMPASSSSSKPLKITDYYKPSQSFSGYGYGYGGL